MTGKESGRSRLTKVMKRRPDFKRVPPDKMIAEINQVLDDYEKHTKENT